MSSIFTRFCCLFFQSYRSKRLKVKRINHINIYDHFQESWYESTKNWKNCFVDKIRESWTSVITLKSLTGQQFKNCPKNSTSQHQNLSNMLLLDTGPSITDFVFFKHWIIPACRDHGSDTGHFWCLPRFRMAWSLFAKYQALWRFDLENFFREKKWFSLNNDSCITLVD